jgi:thiol-disulfide isomerase/thioredoxin
MLRYIAPAIVCIAAAPLFAQVDEQAKTLLKESGAAIKSLKGVTFTVTANTQGAGGMTLGGNATITYLRPASIAHTPGSATPVNLASPTFMAEGMSEVATEGKLNIRVALVENQMVTWIDEAAKTVFQKPLMPKTDGDKFVNRVRTVLFPPPVLEAEPFEKELRATKISIDEPQMIGGEACDVVKIITDNKSEHTVAISQKDKLPRVYQISRPVGNNQSLVRRWEVSNVKLNAAATAKDITLKTPDGFKFVKEEAKPVETAATAPKAPATPAVAQGGLAVGTVAPALDLKLAGGGDLNATTTAGSVTVLGFWSPLVPASAEMAKSLQGLSGKVDAKSVKIFAVACREGSDEEPRVQKFIADNKLTIRSALNGDTAATGFNVRGFPSVAVLNKEGKIAAFFESIPSVDALKAVVDAASK